MINRRWQRGGREDVGLIGNFAAAPRAEAAVAQMLDAAERWLIERGVQRVIAPFGGDAFHGFAAQVDAFDERAPIIARRGRRWRVAFSSAQRLRFRVDASVSTTW
jgi:hypothetical protein